ncbi:GNAT family protein [Hyphococcus formosus]|uniref:GNAT family N-acetyltransferase n=1 Tax=Hyphococcus formosus TaxID=3143534 RepID=UPI00398B41D8
MTKTNSQTLFDPVLVHDPVVLRSAMVSDYPAWHALREQSREHLTRWEEKWAPHQATLSSFKRRLRSYERDRKRGGGLSLLIFRQSDDTLLGGVTLTNIRYGASRSGLMGYWLGEKFTGRGYATAAVNAVIHHAFEKIDLNRIVAACQPENGASQKLLENCGFSQEGIARNYLKINGEWRDHLIYSKIASDGSLQD